MKTIIISIAMLISLSVGAQSKTLKGQISEHAVVTTNIGITLKADSLKEITSLNDDDIRAILETSWPNEGISFEFICENDAGANYQVEHFSLKIEGNSNDLDTFMNRYQKAKETIKKIYNK